MAKTKLDVNLLNCELFSKCELWVKSLHFGCNKQMLTDMTISLSKTFAVLKSAF